jgi:16S rRNA (cytosine967-C5)-methyltransferase
MRAPWLSWGGDLARTGSAPGATALAGAARAVAAVVARGESADVALASAAAGPERAAVRAIALGTLRWYLRLVPALESLLERPSAVPSTVHALLAAAAHQVEYSRNAPEASVHAAVDAARLLGAPRTTGLVNAVLRRFVAERTVLLAVSDATTAARSAHPAWLAGQILTAWPAQGPSVLEANNRHPPMTLRVDLSRISRPAYRAQLAAAGIDAYEIQWCDSAITLNHPIAVASLPGFAEGIVSVQDAGAQLAAGLLDVRPNMRVLDACAAPGGKTGHLLELLGAGADVTAVDVDATRVGLIRENLQRLRRTARLIVADLREREKLWDGRPFERILLDVPCSATGVIRRHPDIKFLRRGADIAAFAATQHALLGAAAGLLAPGGRMLYATCSVLPQENEEVVRAFLAAAPRMQAVRLPAAARLAPGALERPVGMQLLPGAEAGTDGFYYACLEKTTGET